MRALVLSTCYLLGPEPQEDPEALWGPGLGQAFPAGSLAAPASVHEPGPIWLAALFPL